jgi:hypothetical protein
VSAWRRRTLAGAAACVAGVLVGVSGATAGPLVGSVTPFGTTPNAWGWVTGRLPTVVTYLVPPRDGGDSAATQVYVTRQTYYQHQPAYWVTYPNAKNGRLIAALATALSTKPILCGIADPVGPTDIQEVAACHDRAGNLVNSQFSAMFVAIADSPAGRIAYLFANDPTAASYTPSGANHNVSGVPNTVTKLGTGRWEVDLPNMGTAGGTVQLTADTVAAACRAVSWTQVVSATSTGMRPDGNLPGNEAVDVTCRDFNGNPVDAYWWMVFADGVSLQGDMMYGTPTGAYLWANQPTAASYHPSAAYRYTSAGPNHVPTISRKGTGSYLVTLPGMPKGGAAFITPTGNGKSACALSSIRTNAAPQQLGVHCWRPDGTPVDSPFTLAFMH